MRESFQQVCSAAGKAVGYAGQTICGQISSTGGLQIMKNSSSLTFTQRWGAGEIIIPLELYTSLVNMHRIASFHGLLLQRPESFQFLSNIVMRAPSLHSRND